MTGESVYSTFADGTDGVFLDQLGQVDDWQHTLTFPGGASTASFTFAVPSDFAHPAVKAGRYVTVQRGAAVIFQGRLNEPDRSQTPWQITVTGIAAMAKEHVVVTGAAALNSNVDYAISNGLPWLRVNDLTSPSSVAVPGQTLDDALGLLAADNDYWSLSPLGVITTPTLPTTPTFGLWVRDLPGRTLDSYKNVVVVLYRSTSTGGVLTTRAQDNAAIAARGPLETTLDLTSTPMSLSDAQAAGQAYLAQLLAPVWTDKFVAEPGALCTLDGSPIDQATMPQGQMVRVFGLTSDDLPMGPLDLVMSDVDYSGASSTVALTPLASQIRGFGSTLTDLTAAR